jgi:ParB family transcriptional regulator, chromosome partitioning protein
MTIDQTTADPSAIRTELDPRSLLVDVNIRTDPRLDKDFIASIKDLGVLVPITAVRTTTGDVRVRFGHRRTLAAIEAGLATVPVEIVGDDATDDAAQIERILTQHAENAHRAALTGSEQLGVVEQLCAFGMSAAQIAKRTKIKRGTVDASLAVVGSELAKAAIERYDFLTLEQAAAVAEFDNDPDAVKGLVVAAQQGRGFDHLVQQLREDRDDEVLIEAKVAELVTAGITVIDRPAWTDTPKDLDSLARRGAGEITPESHVECPGHAAYVDTFWDCDEDAARADNDERRVAEATYVCLDPVQYGYVAPASESSRAQRAADVDDDARKEAEKAERRRVLANNKAWCAAETVRREWLKNFVTRKTAPKGALRYIFAEIAEGSHSLRDGMEAQHEFAHELLGIEAPTPRWQPTAGSDGLINTLSHAGDARAQVVTLALVLGAFEATLGVHTWRSQNAVAARYLTQITAWGYELSEIEQSVIDQVSDHDEFDDDDDAG